MIETEEKAGSYTVIITQDSAIFISSIEKEMNC